MSLPFSIISPLKVDNQRTYPLSRCICGVICKQTTWNTARSPAVEMPQLPQSPTKHRYQHRPYEEILLNSSWNVSVLVEAPNQLVSFSSEESVAQIRLLLHTPSASCPVGRTQRSIVGPLTKINIEHLFFDPNTMTEKLVMGMGRPFPPILPDSENYDVDFDGLDDPTHPYNWKFSIK